MRFHGIIHCVLVSTLVVAQQSGGALAFGSYFAASRSRLFSSKPYSDGEDAAASSRSFEAAVLNRYSCKKFQRSDGSTSTETSASKPDPAVLQKALHCLDLARRTPTAFNTQPWKVVLVSSPEQKIALSKYCLGANGGRVRDSDCTAIFLADRQVFWSLARFRKLVRSTSSRPISRRTLLQMQFYILLFSSGYPLPRILRAPISFCVRTAVSFVNLFTSWFYPLPSLANAETWSSKQVLMVAMTYMLGCSSIGLATIPMEGINASGIRKVIKAPSRYAIPLIVSTGLPLDDTKVSNALMQNTTDRYPMEEVVFGDSFGAQMQMAPAS